MNDKGIEATDASSLQPLVEFAVALQCSVHIDQTCDSGQHISQGLSDPYLKNSLAPDYSLSQNRRREIDVVSLNNSIS